MPNYDEGAYFKDNLVDGSSSGRQKVWRSCMWVGMPIQAFDPSDVFTADEESINPYGFITSTAKVRLRVSKPYERYATKDYYLTPISDTSNADNAWYPLYNFSTSDIATELNNNDTAIAALAIINVVPNPYYAYSSYENNKIDNRIKITNLPDVCKINIYSVSGTLVRQFKKDSRITFQDWDLKNQVGIPIGSGVYIIHVDVPGVGERILKWFGAMRPPILDNF